LKPTGQHFARFGGMRRLTRILVALDFDRPSASALDYAIELARQVDASVAVLHTYELPIYGFPDGSIIASSELAASTLDRAQGTLAALCDARRDSGVELTQIVQAGTAWEEVNRVADEISADLIVIGTHGRRGLSRALHGSVAEQIVRTATRPVLTVHEKIEPSLHVACVPVTADLSR
jgi:nucleotide-binding universal stress UspA family protein